MVRSVDSILALTDKRSLRLVLALIVKILKEQKMMVRVVDQINVHLYRELMN